MRWYARLSLMLLLLAAATGSWHLYHDGWLPFGGGDMSAATPPRHGAAETAEPGSASAPVQANDSSAGEPRRPAFDIVRVDASGRMIIAGLAPPGWTVRVMAQGRVVGEVEAGFDGSWMLMPETSLAAGDHAMSLMAEAPDGARSLWGRERVAVSVAPSGAPAVVALSPDNQPTRLLQAGQIPDEAPSGKQDAGRNVTVSAVDYEDDVETGRLYISGSAQPGARVALYLDNRFIGSAKADAEGAWEFGLTDILHNDRHVLRADHVDMDRGKVLSRAQVQFDPQGVAVAGAPDSKTRTAMAEIAGERRLRNQLREDEVMPGSADEVASGSAASRGQAVIVRRGDTLWHIAEKYYGSGVRYTKIFHGNRGQIRNPHLIYPGQQFDLPN